MRSETKDSIRHRWTLAEDSVFTRNFAQPTKVHRMHNEVFSQQEQGKLVKASQGCDGNQGTWIRSVLLQPCSTSTE